MLQVGNLKFFIIFSILLSINDTSGLKCWRCSSDTTNAKYCGETVDQSQITEKQQNWVYVECVRPKNLKLDNIESLIPKCKVMLQIVNEVRIYSRSCHWKEENVPANSCLAEKYPSFIKTVACNTCTDDGCNNKLTNVSEDEPIEESSAIVDVLSKTALITFATSLVFGLL